MSSSIAVKSVSKTQIALFSMLHLTCGTSFFLYSSCSLSVWCIIITQLFSIIMLWSLADLTFLVAFITLILKPSFSQNLSLQGSGPSSAQFVCLSLCVSVCVSVCPRGYIWNRWTDLYEFFVQIPWGRGSILIWRRCDTSCTSGVMDDVTFDRSWPQTRFSLLTLFNRI